MTDPRREYEARRDAHRAQRERLRARGLQLSTARGVVFLLALVALALAWADRAPAWGIAAPALLFVGLVVAHERVRLSEARAARAEALYEVGLERLAGRWSASAPDGAGWRTPEHPYASDLDILGPRSLFHRLCAARTIPGQERLARWLLAPAAPPEIRRRQQAVRELAPQLDARERLALAGSELPLSIDPSALRAWAEHPPLARLAALRAITALVAAGLVATFVGWLALGWGYRPLLVMLPVGYVWSSLVARRVAPILQTMELPARELEIYALLLVQIEETSFEGAALRELQARILEGAGRPSQQISRLRSWLEALDWGRNQLFAPLAALLLWRTQWGLAVEAWRQRCGPRVATWLAGLGEFEALHSLAREAFEHPHDCVPEIVDEGSGFVGFVGEALGHPLLPEDVVVRNDVRLDEGHRLYVVSGSNMSGKTTLLRTVGCNAVLALAGGRARARRLRLSSLAVGASLRSTDSLQSGESRFKSELVHLRRVLALTEGEPPLLFLLDELYHGTHSHDRRLGAQAFLHRLLGRGALGLVTTHDLAITKIVEDLEDVAANVHFQDDVEDGKMVFDYRMRDGVVTRSNALALMRAEGLIE